MSTLRHILFLIIPFSLIMLLLRAQIVRVILGSGQFDWKATIATADTLAFFALSLFAQAVIPLLARSFYALSDTITPLVVALISELATLGLAIVFMKNLDTPLFLFPHHVITLPRSLGAAWLALASSAGACINALGLYICLRKKIKSLNEQGLTETILKISVAGLLMALTIQLVKYPLSEILDLNRIWGILLHGLISGSLGILVYLLVCWLLKVQEMIDLRSALKTRWLRLRHLPTNLDEAENIP